MKLYTILLSLLFLIAVSELAAQSATKVTGTLSLGTEIYGAQDIEDRSENFRYSILANPTIQSGSWKIPIGLRIVNQGIDSKHPFFRLGTSPTHKWLKLHFGHRSMNWSNYSLSNRTVLGAGVEMHPSIFRFAFMAGRTLPKREYDTSQNAASPRYQRNLLATRIGIGTKTNYVDFILLRGRDDSNSITIPDSVSHPYPEENMVLGLKTQQLFIKDKIFFEGEFNASAYNLNQESREFAEVSSEGVVFPRGLFTSTIATYYAAATKAELGYQEKGTRLSLMYTYVEPEYSSMGAFYNRNDVEAWDFKIRTVLDRRRLYLDAKAGVSHNNIREDLSLQTKRSNFMLGLRYNPIPTIGAGFRISNYQTNQKPNREVVDRDSFRTETVSANYQIHARYSPRKDDLAHIVSTSLGWQDVSRELALNDSTVESKNLNLGLSYRLSKISWDLHPSLGLSYFKAKMVPLDRQRWTYRIGMDKGWLKGSLKTGIDFSHSFNDQDLSTSSQTISTGLRVSYSITKKDRVNARLAIMNQNFESSSLQDFNETRLSLRYQRRF